MNKIKIALLFIILLSIIGYVFFKEHEVEFVKIETIKTNENQNYPNAYEFIHTNEELISYINRNAKTKYFFDKLKKEKFDFENFSYAIVYGNELKSMRYSYYISLFKDPTPKQYKPKNKLFVDVEYSLSTHQSNKNIYIYRINSNKKIRGIYGP